MATAKLWNDEEVSKDPRVKQVFEDIRATRKSEFVNNFWRALANQPALLERTWSSIKAVIVAGALDPLTKELIYIAVSTVNSCSYCVHSHTAAARAKGLTEEQHRKFTVLAIHQRQTPVPATARADSGGIMRSSASKRERRIQALRIPRSRKTAAISW